MALQDWIQKYPHVQKLLQKDGDVLAYRPDGFSEERLGWPSREEIEAYNDAAWESEWHLMHELIGECQFQIMAWGITVVDLRYPMPGPITRAEVDRRIAVSRDWLASSSFDEEWSVVRSIASQFQRGNEAWRSLLEEERTQLRQLFTGDAC